VGRREQIRRLAVHAHLGHLGEVLRQDADALHVGLQLRHVAEYFVARGEDDRVEGEGRTQDALVGHIPDFVRLVVAPGHEYAVSASVELVGDFQGFEHD
jgi:hypothetical protein